jgi:hypothetical protein
VNIAQYLFQKVVILVKSAHFIRSNTGKFLPVFAGIEKSRIPENRFRYCRYWKHYVLVISPYTSNASDSHTVLHTLWEQLKILGVGSDKKVWAADVQLYIAFMRYMRCSTRLICGKILRIWKMPDYLPI